MSYQGPKVVLYDESSNPIYGIPSNALRGVSFGRVSGATGTLQAVRATAYTEQTTNAQRSMSSSSASDTSAGTGARQVKITYYTAAMAGPFTETITMNGTTAVNTVSTTICFIEKMEVISVGSNGSNVGTITLFAAAAAAGGAVGTIGLATLVAGRGDNTTLWAHHYVAAGVGCNVTSFTGGVNQNQGGQVFLMSKDPTVSTSPENPITDSIAYSPSTMSIVRSLEVPLRVTGPARITAYTIPLGNATNHYAGFNFWEAA